MEISFDLVSLAFPAIRQHGVEKVGMGLPSEPIKATLADIGWISGYWQGNYAEGWGEEIWGQSHEGFITGVFRHHVDGKLKFTDLMWLTDRGGTVQAIFKRFDTNFRSMEHSHEPVYFTLTEISASHAVFHTSEAEGGAWMTYQFDGDTLSGRFFLGQTKEPCYTYSYKRSELNS